MSKGSKIIATVGVVVALVVAALLAVRTFVPRAEELVLRGDVHELRPDATHERAAPSRRPRLLVLALDGVDRVLLYEMLEAGELPRLAALLGGAEGSRFAHACFEKNLLTVLPSTTIAAWTTAFTGVMPGVHGITGNELFIREERIMFAPAPVSISDPAPVLEVYVDDAIGRRLDVPTVYDQLREQDPPARIWVAMSQIFRGADRLILAKRGVVASAFRALLEGAVGDAQGRKIYAELDEAVIDAVVDELEEQPTPDVLTVYIAGTDLYAHSASVGPDRARREYLREVLDPRLERLRASLDAHGFLPDAHVVVLSDHGHTDVVHDDRHALSTEGESEPPALLRSAGFRVRPFEWKTKDDADFQAVLAYNGAISFVYLADRSTCPEPGQACEWSRPARRREDVMPVAEAWFRANADGAHVPALRGTLDMVLVRSDGPEPFAVYVGAGETVAVEAFLRTHPHPHYVALASRLRDLGQGPRGDRAGDVVLVARNGDVETADERYYFASKYRSWHGSPSRRDSEVPLIVAHHHRTAAELCGTVAGVLGDAPGIDRVTPLLLRLREESR